MNWLKSLWARFIQFINDLSDQDKLKRKHDALAQASPEKRANENMEQYRDRLINQSERLISLEQYDPALVLMNRAVECFPENARVHYVQGVVLHNLQKYQESMAACNRALHLNPAYFQAYNTRALNWYFGYADAEKALTDFERSLRHRNSDATIVYGNMLLVYRMQGRFQEALATSDMVIRNTPHSAAAYSNRALIYFALGDFESAYDAIDRSLRLDSRQIFPYINRAIMLAAQGEYHDALEDLDYAEQCDPGDTVWHILAARAKVYMVMGMSDAAQDTIKRAFELHPDNQTIWGERAIIAYGRGEKDQARLWWDKFVAARPRYKLPENAAYFCDYMQAYIDIMQTMQREFAVDRNEDT